MRCSACGKDFPSKYYFSAPGLCTECFGKLPREQRERLRSQHRGFGEDSHVHTASRPLYLASIFGGLPLALALLIVAGDAPYSVSRKVALDLIVVADILMLFSLFMLFVLIYKAWSVIQDGHASTTPAKAVWGLFIPLVNILWNFQVWYGFAKDFNRYIARHSLRVSKLPQGLFLAVPILGAPVLPGTILALLASGLVVTLPALAAGLLGLVFCAELVVTFAALYKMCGAINSLAATPVAAVEPPKPAAA